MTVPSSVESMVPVKYYDRSFVRGEVFFLLQNKQTKQTNKQTQKKEDPILVYKTI